MFMEEVIKAKFRRFLRLLVLLLLIATLSILNISKNYIFYILIGDKWKGRKLINQGLGKVLPM